MSHCGYDLGWLADAMAELSSLKQKLGAAASADASLRAALAARAPTLDALSLPYDVLEEQMPQPSEAVADMQCTADISELLSSLEATGRALDVTLSEARAACNDAEVEALTDQLVHHATAPGDGAAAAGDGRTES